MTAISRSSFLLTVLGRRCFSSRNVLPPLQNCGRVISATEFHDFLSRTDHLISEPEQILDSDDQKMVFARFPHFVVQVGPSLKAPLSGADSPLHLAVRREDLPEIRRLVQCSADINARGVEGRTPLFEAVETRNPLLVDALMSLGADPNTYETCPMGTTNFTPYHLALQLRCYEITRLFIEKWNVPADQSIRYHDYGWPPEAIEYAIPPDPAKKKLTPSEHSETEKILLLLLEKTGHRFIRQRNLLLERARQNNMTNVAKLVAAGPEGAQGGRFAAERAVGRDV